MQESYIGWDGLQRLSAIIAAINPRSLCLFTGQSSFDQHPLRAKIFSILEKYNCVQIRADGSNPQVEHIEKHLPLVRQLQPQVVLAIGGGSVLDLAKLVTFFASQNLSLANFFQLTQTGSSLPLAESLPTLISVPTTAGTGSEATQFATFYKGPCKHSLDHPAILPRYAIIDPSFSATASSYLTACCGMDALSQAVESFWAVKATPASCHLALSALSLIFNHLESAVLNPTPEDRLAMAKGAYLAGQAIQLTRTTAAHALSYPLTALFSIPHGHAVGMLLPFVFEFNAQVNAQSCNDPRKESYVKAQIQELVQAFSCDSFATVKLHLLKSLKKIGLSSKLSDFGVSKDDLPKILEHGFNPARVGNNPRVMDYLGAMNILNNCL